LQLLDLFGRKLAEPTENVTQHLFEVRRHTRDEAAIEVPRAFV
jgi:hypothetical protein